MKTVALVVGAFVLIRGAAQAPDVAAESSVPVILPKDNGALVILVEDDQGELQLIAEETDNIFEQLSVIADAASGGEILTIETDSRSVFEAADPLRPQQYSLDTIAIDSLPAGLTGKGVTVAILDTGIRRTHEEFAGRLLQGADCVHTTDEDAGKGCDPTTSGPADRYHGSHVAGVLGAAEGNGVGIHGVAPEVTILPIRVLAADGIGYLSDMTQGVLFAISQDVDVINFSIATRSDFKSLNEALNKARDLGIDVVVASGNEGRNGNPKIYPAAYGSTIAVGAVDATGAVASFSSGGAWLDVVAPGVGIVSAQNDSDSAYGTKSGTSFAAPQVAGLVALMLQADPSLTPSQVRFHLQQTATDRGAPGRDPLYGSGIVDAQALLRAVFSSAPVGPLSAKSSTQGTVLSWPSSPWALSYEIYREGALIASGNSVGTSYLDGDAVAGQTYQYEVRVALPLDVTQRLNARVTALSDDGYWLIDERGIVYSFGDAGALGNATSTASAVAIDSTDDGLGYWTLSASGQVEAFGSALDLGDVDISALAPGEIPATVSGTPSGKGYWVFTSTGRVLTFGDAVSFGDLSGLTLNGPVVDSAATPDGNGYFIV
ncbi:MAG: S8 family serine peptidase, partial [Acidimicrobiales bacterium]